MLLPELAQGNAPDVIGLGVCRAARQIVAAIRHAAVIKNCQSVPSSVAKSSGYRRIERDLVSMHRVDGDQNLFGAKEVARSIGNGKLVDQISVAPALVEHLRVLQEF